MRALLLLLALVACAAPGEAPVATDGDYVEHRLAVPVAGREIFTRLCLPRGGATQPLVLINHGSPSEAQRPRQNAASCWSEPVRFFLARGHAVGLPLRRGYGVNGGPWVETYGRCDAPDYRAAGLTTADDIQAALAVLSARPDVPRGPAVIIGQSAGGWGAMAMASRNPPGVRAYVNMAGGRGGRRYDQANNNCSPDALVRAAGEFGATARAPMLWVYTANDSFFDPVLAARMHAAFTRAGGQARLVALGQFGRDGHSLFYGSGGAAIWGPVMAEFLR